MSLGEETSATAVSIVGIGEAAPLRGYALAGLHPIVADTAQQVVDAWNDLPAATRLVVLTPAAAGSLGDRVREVSAPLVVVLPDGSSR